MNFTLDLGMEWSVVSKFIICKVSSKCDLRKKRVQSRGPRVMKNFYILTFVLDTLRLILLFNEYFWPGID